jgi:hypothetical protein
MNVSGVLVDNGVEYGWGDVARGYVRCYCVLCHCSRTGPPSIEALKWYTRCYTPCCRPVVRYTRVKAFQQDAKSSVRRRTEARKHEGC